MTRTELEAAMRQHLADRDRRLVGRLFQPGWREQANNEFIASVMADIGAAAGAETEAAPAAGTRKPVGRPRAGAAR